MYGTTRQPVIDAGGKVTGYSLVRDSKIHYGRVLVTIPKGHKVGSEGGKSLLPGEDPPVVLHEVHPIEDVTAFLDIAKRDLPPVTGPDNGYVLVFIHGFNNRFEDVAVRAAQLGADLGVPPNDMFMFSWASMHSVAHYPADEATVDVSETYLKDFLATVLTAAHGRTVHIIAHSMGNRAMLRVAAAMAADLSPGKEPPFGQVILAAADVDSQLFRELGPSYHRVAHRTTVYLSPYDRAVEASDLVHEYPRVGCGSTPQVTLEYIESVVSTLPDALPSHAYFAETLPLLTDIKNLILRDTPARPPSEWTQLGTYWRAGKPVESLNPLNLACKPDTKYAIPTETSR
ncbi:alpha/beta hydrolase [Burkholderia stagnalis]